MKYYIPTFGCPDSAHVRLPAYGGATEGFASTGKQAIQF